VPQERQQALFCCVSFVSGQFLKGILRKLLIMTMGCFLSGPISLSQETERSNKKAKGPCGSRFKIFTSLLKS
jgi:hypothetical protein